MMTDEELTKKYNAYVDTFRDGTGRLGEMLELKLEHTRRVVANAESIADGEGFDGRCRRASLSAALLHDTGRYEQLTKYNTFNDAESVDHAVLSHELVKKFGWLDGQDDADAILMAVLYHNRRELPSELDPLTEAVAKTVRDADKLDIFLVLEERVAKTDWRKDSRAFWNLKPLVAPNPPVVEAILAQKSVDYADIRSLSDFVLIQVGWMISGLAFATSRKICAERGHLAFRRRFLREIGGGEAAERVCEFAEERNQKAESR